MMLSKVALAEDLLREHLILFLEKNWIYCGHSEKDVCLATEQTEMHCGSLKKAVCSATWQIEIRGGLLDGELEWDVVPFA